MEVNEFFRFLYKKYCYNNKARGYSVISRTRIIEMMKFFLDKDKLPWPLFEDVKSLYSEESAIRLIINLTKKYDSYTEDDYKYFNKKDLWV